MSLTRTLKWPSETVCKSRATHRALITCNMLCATWYEGTAQLSSLTELKSHLIWLNFSPVCRRMCASDFGLRSYMRINKDWALSIAIVDHTYIVHVQNSRKQNHSNLLSELFHCTPRLYCVQIHAGIYVFLLLFRSCVNECVEVTMSGSSPISCRL